MSTPERDRDTQFAEWASLLWDELEAFIRQDPGFIPEGESRRVKFLSMIQRLISRRVYDLAQFIVSQAYADDLKPKEILHKNGKIILMYPENLKEWYEGKNYE